MKSFSQSNRAYPYTILILSIFVLVPFFLFGAELELLIEQRLVELDSTRIFLFVILLLSVDILLPIPSSIVSAWGCYSLGVIGGLLSVFIGMSLSCLIGYMIGRYGSRYFSRRYLGQMTAVNAGVGVANMILLRGIPVLAEATVVAMGIGRYPRIRFLIWSSMANIGIASLYALMGHMGKLIDNPFFVIIAGVIIPVLLFIFRYVMTLKP